MKTNDVDIHVDALCLYLLGVYWYNNYSTGASLRASFEHQVITSKQLKDAIEKGVKEDIIEHHSSDAVPYNKIDEIFGRSSYILDVDKTLKRIEETSKTFALVEPIIVREIHGNVGDYKIFYYASTKDTRIDDGVTIVAHIPINSKSLDKLFDKCFERDYIITGKNTDCIDSKEHSVFYITK